MNQELRFPLPFDLTGLVFFDAGQVWDTTDGLVKALGLRARAPLGLFRIDVEFPLDLREGEESYKLYFGFGNAFGGATLRPRRVRANEPRRTQKGQSIIGQA